MDDRELQRYSRHILLPQVDVAGQASIGKAKIMIVGLGGLGSPVALYLAAAGVAELVLVDDDQVELSNLQRQILHRETWLGKSKVSSAQAVLGRLNSTIKITTHNERFDAQKLNHILCECSVLVDCTDSFSSRDDINRACVALKIPVVSAAAIGFEAQITTFDFRNPSSPCYRCLYDALDDTQLSCAESGVFSPLLGVAGSMQAIEALKIAAGMAPSLVGRLSLFDALSSQWQNLGFKKRSDCPVCASA